MLHPGVWSFSYWGGIFSGIVALMFAGMSVNQWRRVRDSLRRVTTQGHLVSAKETFDKFGEVNGKVVEVVFTTENGTRIKFLEDVDERSREASREVTVHYDPRHPRDTATVYTGRAAFARVLGYMVAFLLCAGLFIGVVVF